MFKKLMQFIMGGAVIMIVSYLFDGVYVKDFTTAFILAIILFLLNTFIKPILTIIALPMTILTLGLFQFVVNALVLSLASSILYPDFYISSFGLTIITSIVISILYSILGIDKKDE